MSFVCGPALLAANSGISYPYLVYDTFSGGGTLDVRVGEKGTPWTGGGATYTLAGGFACPISGFGSPVYATPTSFDNGYVEMIVNNGVEYLQGGAVFQSHFEGLNGSTTLIDNSLVQAPVAWINNAQISTATARFGTSSLKIGTSGVGERDFVRVGPFTDVIIPAGRPFCLECFVNFSDFVARAIIQITETSVPDDFSWSLVRLASDSQIYLAVGTVGGGDATYVSTPAGTLPTINIWHHVALTRDATSMKVWLNGVQQGGWSGTVSSRNWNDTITVKNLQIGTWGSATPQNNNMFGFIDEVRLVVGSSVYTSAFIPPVRQFAD